MTASMSFRLRQQLGAMFSTALAQAADNFGTGNQLPKNGGEHSGAAPSAESLAGVVIFVSKKLAGKQGVCVGGDRGRGAL